MTRIAFLITASTLFAGIASADTFADRMDVEQTLSLDRAHMRAWIPDGASFAEAMRAISTITMPELPTAERASPQRLTREYIPEARAKDEAAAKRASRKTTFRPKR